MKILTYTLGVCAANCYLLYDEKSGKACLIDAPDYDDNIMGSVTSPGLSLEYAILTHGHFDHILGANAFKNKTGAKIVAHEFETKYLENPDKSMTIWAMSAETVSLFDYLTPTEWHNLA